MDQTSPSSDEKKNLRGASLSGKERNHLFLNLQGKQFQDIAGVAGVDHHGDSRAFVILDYDRDGYQDIALVNANAPLFQLYHNQLGKKNVMGNAGGSTNHKSKPGQMLALRFVGGNHAGDASKFWSNRDGYGAMVTVELGDLTIRREHRAGEGFASQNSATMIVGIGERNGADKITVRWPSGVVQEIPDVSANTIVTVYENPEHSPSGEHFVSEPYKASSRFSRERYMTRHNKTSGMRLQLSSKIANGVKPKLRMYTTTATWCASCKRELPQLERLRAVLDPKLVGMFGVPVDHTEKPEQFKAYVAKYQPAYELLIDLPVDEMKMVQKMVGDALNMDGLPATILTDSNGYVLKIMWGVPSASEIKRLLATL